MLIELALDDAALQDRQGAQGRHYRRDGPIPGIPVGEAQRGAPSRVRVAGQELDDRVRPGAGVAAGHYHAGLRLWSEDFPEYGNPRSRRPSRSRGRTAARRCP